MAKTIRHRLLKRLDWYIIKKFLGTYFFTIALIIIIMVVFDYNEHIDKLKDATTHEIIFDYYLNFVPYFINMFSPLFVFITVIFFTSRMAADSEIIAILSCGVSYRRMMRPYIISAALIALLSLSLSLWVIPRSNVTRLKFESTYVKHRNPFSTNNVHYQIDTGITLALVMNGYNYQLEDNIVLPAVTLMKNMEMLEKNRVSAY